MPSPVGHALGGLILGLAVWPGTPRPGLSALLLVVGAAVAPDLDFLWGRHNMETHSLGAAVLAGLVVLAWTRSRAWRLAGRGEMRHGLRDTENAPSLTETQKETGAFPQSLCLSEKRASVPRSPWRFCHGLRALAVSIAWASHVLFDWLGSDTTRPIGVMALWPVNSSYYFADAFLFEAILRRTHQPNFWSHNLWAVATEVLLLAPLAALAAWYRWRK